MSGENVPGVSVAQKRVWVRSPDRRSLVWKFFQSICRFFLSTFFDLKVHGKENVPRTGGAILAANHESYLDPIIVGVPLRRPVSFMAKSELFEHGAFSWLIRELHAFPVRQGKGDRAAINETVERLKEGHLLNIFPEGSRTEDGALAPMQSGVALVARRAGVPIVPIAITGSFRAWPKQRKLFRCFPLRVMYGKPIDTANMKSDEILATLDKRIREMLDQLRQMEDRYKVETTKATHHDHKKARRGGAEIP